MAAGVFFCSLLLLWKAVVHLPHLSLGTRTSDCNPPPFTWSLVRRSRASEGIPQPTEGLHALFPGVVGRLLEGRCAWLAWPSGGFRKAAAVALEMPPCYSGAQGHVAPWTLRRGCLCWKISVIQCKGYMPKTQIVLLKKFFFTPR